MRRATTGAPVGGSRDIRPSSGTNLVREKPPVIDVFTDVSKRVSTQLGAARVTISRACSRELGDRIWLTSNTTDGVGLIYQVADMPDHDLWVDCRHNRIRAEARRTIALLDLGAPVRSRLEPRFSSINVHIPNAAIRAFGQLHDVAARSELIGPVPWGTRDTFIASLEPSLLLMLDQPETGNRLAHDHISLALLSHLIGTYGGRRVPDAPAKGGLARAQLRRAQEMMADDLARELPLAEVAQGCGLSPSHFSRAFKISTGLAPHAWLQQYRVDKAKALLRRGDSRLADIAIQCGFADQSHFNRVFARLVGAPPGVWQREHGVGIAIRRKTAITDKE